MYVYVYIYHRKYLKLISNKDTEEAHAFAHTPTYLLNVIKRFIYHCWRIAAGAYGSFVGNHLVIIIILLQTTMTADRISILLFEQTSSLPIISATAKSIKRRQHLNSTMTN